MGRGLKHGYQARTDALDVDRDFYARLAAGERALVDSFVIPIRSGRAWPVRAGQLCRIVVVEGPQVGDLNLWSLHDPREHLWAAKTRQLQAAHVTVGDRLWSTFPWVRPMVTITADTVAYGVDEDGARCHDLLGSRCDPYVGTLLSGEEGDLADFSCHSNLTRAVLPWGLTEYDVHDVLNVFQVTGLDDDRYFMKACPAEKGDYFEFFAEIDLLCALSTCPGGDLSLPIFGPDAVDPVEVCRPLGVEVYQPARELLDGWAPASPVGYRGLHGITMPTYPRPGDAPPA